MSHAEAVINVAYRFKHGYHVFTSPDVNGLYVASQNAQRAFNAVAPSLHTLLAHKLSETYKPENIIVAPIQTFDEFIERMNINGNDVEPTMEARPFSMKIAA
jgi:hypothetical protein